MPVIVGLLHLSPPLSVLRPRVALLGFALAASFHSVPAQAQALPAGVHLGMTEAELQAALPALERVARPQRMAGGLAGNWRAAQVTLAGLPFEPTYYFGDRELKRIEYVAAAPQDAAAGAAAYQAIVEWGRGVYGPELASTDPGSEMAAWAQGDTDVYAQRIGDARRGSVRLVYKARLLKDASQL